MNIKFLRGTLAQYLACSKNADTLYFITDTGALYLGEKLIGKDYDASYNLSTVLKVGEINTLNEEDAQAFASIFTAGKGLQGFQNIGVIIYGEESVGHQTFSSVINNPQIVDGQLGGFTLVYQGVFSALYITADLATQTLTAELKTGNADWIESLLPVYNGENEGGAEGGGLQVKEITLNELVEMVNADNFGVSVNVSLKDPQGQGQTLGMFSGNIFDFNTYPAFVVAHTATDYESTNGVIDNRTDTVTSIQILKVNDTTTMVGGNVIRYVYTNSATLPTREVVFSVDTIEELQQFIQAIYVYAGGTSSSGGNNIAIVDELPTENISENTIYLLNKGYADVNVYYGWGNGYVTLAGAVASSIGATPTVYYEVVSELPASPNATDLQAFNPIYCYIYNNVPYVYGNAGSGDMWLTVSALFAQMGEEVEDKGWTSNIANETEEEGLYVTYNGSYISYIRKNGAWITICDNNVNAEEEIELIGEHSEQNDSYLDHIITLSEETKQVILEKFAKNPKGFKIYYPIEITGVDNAESIIVVENASVFKANNSIINMGGNGFYTTLANIIPCCVMLYVELDNSLKFRICDIWKRLLGKPTLTDITPRIKFIY